MYVKHIVVAQDSFKKESNFGGGNETIKFSMIRFLGIFIERLIYLYQKIIGFSNIFIFWSLIKIKRVWRREYCFVCFLSFV